MKREDWCWTQEHTEQLLHELAMGIPVVILMLIAIFTIASIKW